MIGQVSAVVLQHAFADIAAGGFHGCRLGCTALGSQFRGESHHSGGALPQVGAHGAQRDYCPRIGEHARGGTRARGVLSAAVRDGLRAQGDWLAAANSPARVASTGQLRPCDTRGRGRAAACQPCKGWFTSARRAVTAAPSVWIYPDDPHQLPSGVFSGAYADDDQPIDATVHYSTLVENQSGCRHPTFAAASCDLDTCVRMYVCTYKYMYSNIVYSPLHLCVTCSRRRRGPRPSTSSRQGSRSG